MSGITMATIWPIIMDLRDDISLYAFSNGETKYTQTMVVVISNNVCCDCVLRAYSHPGYVCLYSSIMFPADTICLVCNSVTHFMTGSHILNITAYRI